MRDGTPGISGPSDREIRHVRWRERTLDKRRRGHRERARSPRTRHREHRRRKNARVPASRSPARAALAASRPIFFEVIWRVVRHRSRKVVSRLARVAGGGKRTCKPRRCASSVRERRSTIPVFVHARFRACAARVELLHGRVTRLFFLPKRFSRRRLRPTAGFGPKRCSLSRGKARGRNLFWRQSETRDFARLFISKCQVIRVTDGKSRFPVKSTARSVAKRRLAFGMTWHFKVTSACTTG